jgi:hypothetical protein
LSRSKAIIAVFGSNCGLELAEKIGSEIAKKGSITLTGGTKPGEKYVKERAIKGAGSSPWIGVERRRRAPAGFATKTPYCCKRDSWFVIYSDFEHRRNYLEAYLCDAAIAIKGGEGTTSEVTFAFSLRRPVALIGEWPDPITPKELDKMIADSFKRVGKAPSGNPDLDRLLNEPAIRNGLSTLPAFKNFAMTNSAENAKNIVDWILRKIPPSSRLGDFPKLQGYEENVWPDYREWLAKVESKTGI